MSRTKGYFIERLLTRLGGEVPITGLEISDSTLRLAFFEKGEWKLTSVRLSPGVLVAGQVKDKEAFRKALVALRETIQGQGKKHHKKIGAVMALSSLKVYSQVFTLPLTSEEGIEEAAQLNLQMLAPSDFDSLYSGWQVIGTDEQAGKAEVFGAYGSRAAIDAIQDVVASAGFVVAAVEPRALSVARVVRERSLELDVDKSYVVFNVDDTGLDFLVLRGGKLYFEYFVPWSDIHEGRYLPFAEFQNVIVRHLYQVVNFYHQRWSRSLSAILLTTIGLRQDIEKAIKDNFWLAVKDIPLRTEQPIQPEWLVALGAGLRGLGRRRDDREVSLTGLEVQERFRREQIITFGAFWRLLTPIVMGFAIFLSLGVDAFVRRIEEPLLREAPQLSEEAAVLRKEADEFNSLVEFLTVRQAARKDLTPLLEKIVGIASKEGITLSSLSFHGYTSPIELNGEALSREAIISFKNALEGDGQFHSVALSLTTIECADQRCSFSVSFSSAAPTSSNTN